MQYKIIQAILLATLTINFSGWALSKTGGTPLGGMGTGYLVFDGSSKIRVSSKMPPAAADHAKNNPAERQLSSSGFYLFAGGTGKSRVQAVSEDAKCPMQLADFGTIGDVKFDLKAFGPYWPGEGELKYQLATSPMALFDVAAVNSGDADIEVAVALEASLGNSGSADGTKAINFSDHYLTVDCDGTTPAFSAGGAGSFETNGTLSGTGSIVAAKCSIPAGETVHFKFVISWYASYGSEGYYYQNFYTNAKEVAAAGIENFDSIRTGLSSMVDRLMNSNFPDWYKDRLLNNTYPLIHNSVCAKDGRTAFWEGNYGIIGTIDQGQHAAVFYTFNWPAVQWHELQYWARQQKNNPMGQIHHDFNQGKQSFTAGSTANNRNLKAWDDKTHADYWWFPNTDTWADLNCMFIFKAHELMMATGDKDSLVKSWPALKKSVERLTNQCKGASQVPNDVHSTYDKCSGPGQGCVVTPEYIGSVAITAFAAAAEIAKFCGEDADAEKYAGYYQSMKTAFKTKYIGSSKFGVEASVANSNYHPESHIAGYSWANYLCLKPSMDEEFITQTLGRLRNKQKSGDVYAVGNWVFYNVDHYGGAEIAIGRPDDGLFIHEKDYDWYYKQKPGEVFWQTLQKSDGNTHHDSYMTAPAVWHSYFQYCGYMIDNANHRLWVRPRIPSEMKGEIKNALLLNPKGHGTLNYDENPDAGLGRTQLIKVTFDNPTEVSELVLKNNTDMETPFVQIIHPEGVKEGTVTTEVNDIEKNIRIALASPMKIGPEGVEIGVYTKEPPVMVGKGKTLRVVYPLAMTTNRLVANQAVHFTTDVAGMVTMDLLSLNGAKIGTIMKKSVSSGKNTFVWNGKTTSGRNVGSAVAILRMSTPNGQVMKRVITAR